MERGFFWFVRKAFVVRWNLLAVAAVTVAGVISGHPEAILPIAAGLEVAYLAALSTNGRFRAAMLAAATAGDREADMAAAARRKAQMLESLSASDRRDFERLKAQCVALERIGLDVKGASGGEIEPRVAGYRSEGMNRLLWIYLRLLHSKAAVERFFETIDRSSIEDELAQARARLAALGDTAGDGPNDARRRASLEDHVKTCEVRLANHSLAADNYEFIKDELARLSSKIASLAEMAINRQDAGFISGEVDTVSDSIASSEKAMSELDFLTGWTAADAAAPDLLDISGEGEREPR